MFGDEGCRDRGHGLRRTGRPTSASVAGGAYAEPPHTDPMVSICGMSERGLYRRVGGHRTAAGPGDLDQSGVRRGDGRSLVHPAGPGQAASRQRTACGNSGGECPVLRGERFQSCSRKKFEEARRRRWESRPRGSRRPGSVQVKSSRTRPTASTGRAVARRTWWRRWFRPRFLCHDAGTRAGCACPSAADRMIHAQLKRLAAALPGGRRMTEHYDGGRTCVAWKGSWRGSRRFRPTRTIGARADHREAQGPGCHERP